MENTINNYELIIKAFNKCQHHHYHYSLCSDCFIQINAKNKMYKECNLQFIKASNFKLNLNTWKSL